MDERLKAMFGGQGDGEEGSVNGHYGVSNEKFREMIGEAMKALMMYNYRSKVLDRLFPNLSPEDKCKVAAYSLACCKLGK